MSYKFGKTSLRRMKGVDEMLLKVAHKALAASPIDMTIPWRGGLRSVEEQQEIYSRKASRCDGVDKKSYHQSGKALDINPYGVDAKTYKNYLIVAKEMFKAFNSLKNNGTIPIDTYLHWGGYWSAKDKNGDGILNYIDDKLGWDKPHYELRNKPQRNQLTII